MLTAEPAVSNLVTISVMRPEPDLTCRYESVLNTAVFLNVLLGALKSYQHILLSEKNCAYRRALLQFTFF